MAQGGGDPRAENAGADGGRYDRHLRGALRGGLGDGGLRLRPCGSAQPAYERGWTARSQGRISMVLTPPAAISRGGFFVLENGEKLAQWLDGLRGGRFTVIHSH